MIHTERVPWGYRIPGPKPLKSCQVPKVFGRLSQTSIGSDQAPWNLQGLICAHPQYWCPFSAHSVIVLRPSKSYQGLPIFQALISKPLHSQQALWKSRGFSWAALQPYQALGWKSLGNTTKLESRTMKVFRAWAKVTGAWLSLLTFHKARWDTNALKQRSLIHLRAFSEAADVSPRTTRLSETTAVLLSTFEIWFRCL